MKDTNSPPPVNPSFDPSLCSSNLDALAERRKASFMDSFFTEERILGYFIPLEPEEELAEDPPSTVRRRSYFRGCRKRKRPKSLGKAIDDSPKTSNRTTPNENCSEGDESPDEEAPFSDIVQPKVQDDSGISTRARLKQLADNYYKKLPVHKPLSSRHSSSSILFNSKDACIFSHRRAFLNTNCEQCSLLSNLSSAKSKPQRHTFPKQLPTCLVV